MPEISAISCALCVQPCSIMTRGQGRPPSSVSGNQSLKLRDPALALAVPAIHCCFVITVTSLHWMAESLILIPSLGNEDVLGTAQDGQKSDALPMDPQFPRKCPSRLADYSSRKRRKSVLSAFIIERSNW